MAFVIVLFVNCDYFSFVFFNNHLKTAVNLCAIFLLGQFALKSHSVSMLLLLIFLDGFCSLTRQNAGEELVPEYGI